MSKKRRKKRISIHKLKKLGLGIRFKVMQQRAKDKARKNK